MALALDPVIWGPHFWFMFHTIAITYPRRPTAATKKKYYDLIMNIPLFIPVEEMGSKFRVLLDEYPISAYLDSRESLIRWMHFIHNKVNESLEKPKITLAAFYEKYYEKYKAPHIKLNDEYQWKKMVGFAVIMICILMVIGFLYNK